MKPESLLTPEIETPATIGKQFQERAVDIALSQVAVLTVKVRGKKVFSVENPTESTREQIHELANIHGRKLIIVFRMKDGKKHIYRGNGNSITSKFHLEYDEAYAKKLKGNYRRKKRKIETSEIAADMQSLEEDTIPQNS